MSLFGFFQFIVFVVTQSGQLSSACQIVNAFSSNDRVTRQLPESNGEIFGLTEHEFLSNLSGYLTQLCEKLREAIGDRIGELESKGVDDLGAFADTIG